MKTLIIKKHYKKCRALEQVKTKQWNSPWYFDSQRTGAENTPNRKGWVTWLIFKCNSTSCKALCAVKEDDILKEVKHK